MRVTIILSLALMFTALNQCDALAQGRWLGSDDYGFPGPDSDIYGNYVANTWDDGLEIEGGGRNVRVWNNYVEEAFIPYANAAVTIGPLYFFRNVSGRSACRTGLLRWLRWH